MRVGSIVLGLFFTYLHGQLRTAFCLIVDIDSSLSVYYDNQSVVPASEVCCYGGIGRNTFVHRVVIHGGVEDETLFLGVKSIIICCRQIVVDIVDYYIFHVQSLSCLLVCQVGREVGLIFFSYLGYLYIVVSTRCSYHYVGLLLLAQPDGTIPKFSTLRLENHQHLVKVKPLNVIHGRFCTGKVEQGMLASEGKTVLRSCLRV